MKHLLWMIGIVGGFLLILTLASGMSGQVDIVSIGKEIMETGWSLKTAIGF